MKYQRRIAVFLVVVLWLVMAAPTWAEGDGGTKLNAPLEPSHKLDITRLHHIYQNWNNCGGATLTMGLSYFGYPAADRADQEIARQYLKPNTEDQNVSPWQIVDYVNLVAGPQYGVKALARRGGDLDTLKRLLMNDFPVIIEKGFDVADEGWMGHYLLLIGYDEAQQAFFSYDSYLGPGDYGGRHEPYDFISLYWRQFNNVFIVLYPPDREAEVQAILGDLWQESVGWERAKAQAQLDAAADPQDYWAWFNLGEAATYLGEYDIATVAFRQAFDSRAMPFRTLWYLHGAFEAYYQTGQFNTVLNLAITLQDVTPYIEEANYYRGLVYAAQGNLDQAIFRLNLVLEFNPNFYPAADALLEIQTGTFVGPQQTDG